MVELTQAFVDALTGAGIHTRAAKGTEHNPRLKASAVAVSVEELAENPGGFSAYLGVQDGQELYGMRVQAKMRLDVLSPVQMGAAECRRALDEVCAVLAQGVPGVSITGIVSHAPDYDRVGDCFCALIEVNCRCWLCASSSGSEPGLLEHFILKGALT